jgi:hypothetical protein
MNLLFILIGFLMFVFGAYETKTHPEGPIFNHGLVFIVVGGIMLIDSKLNQILDRINKNE